MDKILEEVLVDIIWIRDYVKNHNHIWREDMKCLSCKKELTGRQRKYCSRICKNRFINLNHQTYVKQQERGRARKLELIRLKGEKCDICGYCNNHAALEFHHSDPAEKEFSLDLRSLSNRKWDVILSEAEKCRLLCSNCHAELHNPDCQM